MHLTADELAQASQGVWLQESPKMIEGIATDSRSLVQGEAFLALRGPRFDGHEHAASIADKASVLIGDALGVQAWSSLATPQLQVKDTLSALADIAAFHRQRLSATRVIAITGSYAKTTVRSMLAHVLTQLGLEVAATKANFNNLIGVPQTLMNVPMTSDVALIECGISEQGEMIRLSAMVQPDIAIITGLSHAHAEGLGDLTAIAQEKVKLMEHLLPQGWCVLGAGVAKTLADADCVLPHTTYDMDKAQAVTWILDQQQLTLNHGQEAGSLQLALPAKHWAEDMALVATVTLQLAAEMKRDWTLEAIAQALQTWRAVDGRLSVYAANEQHDFTLIDDCYNANPASMQAALDTLAAVDGHRIAVLGDMLELGESAITAHQVLNLQGIDEVVCIGALMSTLKEKHAHVRCFVDVHAYVATLLDVHAYPATASTILVKSSRGMQLNQVVDVLLKRGAYAV